MDHVKLDLYVKNLNRCTDGFDVCLPANMKAWHFDRVVHDHCPSDSKPSSMDCFMLVKDAVVFLEFKDSLMSDKSFDIGESFFNKALDSVLIYRRYFANAEGFGPHKDIKLWFIVKDDPIMKESDRIKNKNRDRSRRVEKLDSLASKKVALYGGKGQEGLYFKEYRIFGKSRFEKIVKDLSILDPKQ